MIIYLDGPLHLDLVEKCDLVSGLQHNTIKQSPFAVAVQRLVIC